MNGKKIIVKYRFFHHLFDNVKNQKLRKKLGETYEKIENYKNESEIKKCPRIIISI